MRKNLSSLKSITRRLPYRTACAAVLALVSSVTVACDLDPQREQQLQRLLDAHRLFAYRGTLLHEQNGLREFVTVLHEPDEAVDAMRRLNASAAAPMIQIMAKPSYSVASCTLSQHYSVDFEAGTAVAGRATTAVTLKPKDVLRLGYLMNMDVETGLPLRVMAFTAEGQMLERYEFAEIIVKPVEQDTVSAPTDPIASGYAFASLPPGFVLLAASQQEGPHVVSDGLATASLFVEPLPELLSPGEGASLSGATLTYTRGMTMNGVGYLVTVIGEIPVNTARLLADAIRPRTDAS